MKPKLESMVPVLELFSKTISTLMLNVAIYSGCC
jgi:hypothetical protein